MRLMIEVEGEFFYDVGLRKDDNISSKIVRKFGQDQPRYLEDFIDFYGKDKVRILSYGDLTLEIKYIKDLMK